MSEGRKKNRKSKLEVREDCDYEQQQSEPDLQRYLQLLNADHDYFSRPTPPAPEIVKPIQLAVKIEVEEFDANTPYDEPTTDCDNDTNNYYDNPFNKKLAINKGYCRRVTYSIEKILQTAEYTVSIAPSLPNKILNICLRNLLGSYLIRTEDKQDPYETLVNSALQEWPAWHKQANTRDTPLFYQCYICDIAWWHLQPLKDHVKTHKLDNLTVTLESDGNIACIVANETQKASSIKYIPVEGNCHQCGEDYDYHVKNKCDYKCKFCLRVYPTCGFHKQHEGKCLYRNKVGQKFCVICHQHIKDDEIKEHFLNMHLARSDLIAPMANRVCATCNQIYHCFAVHICVKSGYNTSCNACCRKFATKKLGELHEMLNLSNIFCELCNLVLTKKCTEMEHMFRHTDLFKMVYKCVYCDEIFVDKESMRLHRIFSHRLVKTDKRKCMLLTIPIPERCLRDDAIEVIHYSAAKVPEMIEEVTQPEIPPKEEETVIKKEEKSSHEEKINCSSFFSSFSPENDLHPNLKGQPEDNKEVLNEEQPSNNGDKIENSVCFQFYKGRSKRLQSKKSNIKKTYEVKVKLKNSRPKKPKTTTKKTLKNTFKQKKEQKDRNISIFNELNVQFDSVALEIDAIKIEMDEDNPNMEQSGESPTNADKNRESSLITEKKQKPPSKTVKKLPKTKKNPRSLLKNVTKEPNTEPANAENENLSNVFKVSPEFVNVKIKKEPEDDIDIEEHIVGNTINSNTIESIVTVKEEEFTQFEQEMIKTEPEDDDEYSIDYSDLKVEYRDELNSSTELDYPDSLYPCSKCDLLMYSVKNYLDHLVTRHLMPEDTCPCCGDKIERTTSFVGHFNRHVKNSFVRIRCLRPENVTNAFSSFKCKHSCRVCHITVNKHEFFSHWEKHAYHDNLKFEPRALEPTTVAASNTERKLTPEILTATLNQLLSSSDKRDCCVCSRQFTRKADAKRHLIEHLLADAHVKREQTKALRCQHCYEDFHKPEHYKFHMRDHGGLTIYRCELCQKTFSDSSNFTKHSKVHNVKVLVCDDCNKKFNAKTSLERHIKQVHMHPKIHPCTQCEKHFYTPSDLKRHIRSRHRKTVRFKCLICQQNFKTLKQKWDHEWAMHNVRKYQADCPICKMSFRKFSDVKTHCRTMHNLHVSFKSFCGDSSRFTLNDSDEICMIFENYD